ncbi:MAG: hypothetical protein JXL85_10000 [Bacilli bacterium]|nr:hypothetical protein [Bacilli bacterium]
MILNTEYVKERLKHVYWFAGGPCAGKTTMSNLLVERNGFQYVTDDYMKYRPYMKPGEYDSLKIPYRNMDWEWFFMRETEEYVRWLLDVKLILDFMIVDLLQTNPNHKVIVDTGIEADQILPFIAKDHIIGMFTTDDEIKDKYLYREDHDPILQAIQRTKNPQKALIHSGEVMTAFSHRIEESCLKHNINRIYRLHNLSIEDQYRQVVKMFQL